MLQMELALDDAIRTEILEAVHTAIGDAFEAHQNPLKSRDEIAQMFGVSAGTVDAWIKDGLPRIKVRNMVRIDYREVLEFLRMRSEV